MFDIKFDENEIEFKFSCFLRLIPFLVYFHNLLSDAIKCVGYCSNERKIGKAF